MSAKPVLIHFHIHRRKTGVTSSVENVLPHFEKDFQTYVYGSNVNWKNYCSFSAVKKLIKTNSRAVIHVHRNNELMRALWLKTLGYRFKLVASRHAATKPSGLTLKLLSKANEVIALTDEVKDLLPFDSTVIGHGIDLLKFKPNSEARAHEISQENIIIVAGRVRPKKGQDVFIKAVLPLLKVHCNWAAVIAGRIDDSTFEKGLKDLINAAGLENQVYFIDEIRDIERLYQASKIAVVPSYTEGFSLVCIEAMATGSVTVATKGVGIHDQVIEQGKTGYLFNPESHQELQGILEDLISGDKQIDTQKAIAYITDNWSAQKEAETLKAVYLK